MSDPSRSGDGGTPDPVSKALADPTGLRAAIMVAIANADIACLKTCPGCREEVVDAVAAALGAARRADPDDRLQLAWARIRSFCREHCGPASQVWHDLELVGAALPPARAPEDGATT